MFKDFWPSSTPIIAAFALVVFLDWVWPTADAAVVEEEIIYNTGGVVTADPTSTYDSTRDCISVVAPTTICEDSPVQGTEKLLAEVERLRNDNSNLGCPPESTREMIRCRRDQPTIDFRE